MLAMTDHRARPRPRPRRHRQDRPAGRRPARAQRGVAGPDRLALRRRRRSTGTTAPPGPPALDGRRRRLPRLLPRPRRPRRGRDGRRVRRSRAARGRARGSCCCPAAARTRRRPAEQARPRRSAPTGPSCARAGSCRTSARTSSSSRCSTARSRCRSATCAEPFVDADDIADVAVAALTEDGHAGRVYELTGPRLLTFAEAAAEIGRARPAARSTSMSRPARRLRAPRPPRTASPEDVIALVAYLFAEVLDGRNESLDRRRRAALGRGRRATSPSYARRPRRPACGARDAATGSGRADGRALRTRRRRLGCRLDRRRVLRLLVVRHAGACERLPAARGWRR